MIYLVDDVKRVEWFDPEIHDYACHHLESGEALFAFTLKRYTDAYWSNEHVDLQEEL